MRRKKTSVIRRPTYIIGKTAYGYTATPIIYGTTTSQPANTNIALTAVPMSSPVLKQFSGRLGKRGEVVVPKAIRQLLKVKPGDMLDFQVWRSG